MELDAYLLQLIWVLLHAEIYTCLTDTIHTSCRTVALRKFCCWQTGLSTTKFPESSSSAAKYTYIYNFLEVKFTIASSPLKPANRKTKSKKNNIIFKDLELHYKVGSWPLELNVFYQWTSDMVKSEKVFQERNIHSYIAHISDHELCWPWYLNMTFWLINYKASLGHMIARTGIKAKMQTRQTQQFDFSSITGLWIIMKYKLLFVSQNFQ